MSSPARELSHQAVGIVEEVLHADGTFVVGGEGLARDAIEGVDELLGGALEGGRGVERVLLERLGEGEEEGLVFLGGGRGGEGEELVLD